MIKRYSEIQSINETSIVFVDGTQIRLKDGRRQYSDTCVAERDITANPPYFSFFDGNKIVFDKKELFAKSKRKKDFLTLQLLLESSGYTTYDLA